MSLIYNGVVLPCEAEVIDWTQSGLAFAPGSSGARRRAEKVTQWVWHWTAGEGSAAGCHRVLKGRGLSVHFFLGADGVVYQYADPGKVVCAHAGAPTNARSIGIEQQNVGHGKPNPRVPRVRIPETIHGVERLTSQFLDAQMVAAKQLRVALAAVVPIRVICGSDTLPLSVRNGYVGDLAHFQISDAKRDPGTHFMQAVSAW